MTTWDILFPLTDVLCVYVCVLCTIRLSWVERFMPCRAPVSLWAHGQLSGAFRNAVKPVEGMDTWPVSFNHAFLTQLSKST